MATDSTTFFGSPFLSDVTIRQVSNGKTTDYYGHKAVLCAHSNFFLKLFSENSVKQENGNVIELRDDNPVHFQIMLRFFYTTVFEIPAEYQQDIDLYIVPIGVYALAVKYGVEQLKARAVAACPRNSQSCWSLLSNDWITEIIEAHYSLCNEVGCQMGISIARNFLECNKTFIVSVKFQEIIKKYPVLAADVLSAASLTKGKLW